MLRSSNTIRVWDQRVLRRSPLRIHVYHPFLPSRRRFLPFTFDSICITLFLFRIVRVPCCRTVSLLFCWKRARIRPFNCIYLRFSCAASPYRAPRSHVYKFDDINKPFCGTRPFFRHVPHRPYVRSVSVWN